MAVTGELSLSGAELVQLNRLVATALDEDLGGVPGRDVTTFAIFDGAAVGTGQVVAREAGVFAGAQVIESVCSQVAQRLELPALTVDLRLADGAEFSRGDVIAELSGRLWVLLLAERTMLNIVCRMSGVATTTSAWTAVLAGTSAQVLDTRKTTPGCRVLDKFAVRCGGGGNKRMGLFDVAMIKDNHKLAAGSVGAAIAGVQQNFPDVPLEVEVTTTAEALEAIAAGARFLMCDNMSVELLAETVRQARVASPEPLSIEATGGLSLDVAADYAATGVDYMSVGALTHSAPIVDIALDLMDSSS